MLTYIGSCKDVANWDQIILDLNDQKPDQMGPRERDTNEVQDILDVWNKAGYVPWMQGGSAEWHLFFPGNHFSTTVVDRYKEFVGVSKVNSVWISRIMPGKCAPWHHDLQKPGTIDPKRIHSHIDRPDPGNVVIIEDKHYYNQEQGSTYEWSDPGLWHASFNCGKQPAYLFHIY